jgi:hypothetical protein
MNDSLRKEFILASTDETFKKLCNRLKCSEDILMKYTSKLENTVCELNNCSKCKGLDKCKNNIIGYVNYPSVEKDYLVFSYKPCKYYKNDLLKNKTTFLKLLEY